MSGMSVDSKSLLLKIKENKERRENGIFNSIPFPFPRLSKIFSGFEKGHIINITSGTGQGKTTVGKYLTVFKMYEFFKNNGYKGKIFYFALEESEVDFWASVYSYLLAAHYKIKLKPNQILSKGEWKLSNQHFQLLESLASIIDDMKNYIEIVDFLYNPTSFKVYIDTFFDNPEIGTHIYKEIIEDGRTVRIKVGYEYKDPNAWYIGVYDHINLTTPEKDKLTGMRMTQHQSLSYLVKEYFLKAFSKRYNMVTVFMQQQTLGNESLEFYKDSPIVKKVEPSLAGLSTNKDVSNECHIVLGIFNPSKYNFDAHDGYNLHWLGRNYSSMMILKDRPNGLTGLQVPLYFREELGIFVEVPKSLKVPEFKKQENYKAFLESRYICPYER